MRILAVALLSLMLGGCVTMQQMQKDLNTTTTPLTRSFAEMKQLPLAEGKEVSVEIGKASPLFMFEQGKSFYAAFAVPEPKAVRTIKVKSLLTSVWLPEAGIFYPSFVFLDETNQPIRKDSKFELEEHFALWGGNSYEGTVVLPVEARSFLIYTTSDQMPTLYAYGDGGNQFPLAHTPAGSLTVELSKPYPAGYDFSTAVIKDTVQPNDSSKGDFFCLIEIDGKSVENSSTKTARLNYGRGLSMTPYTVERKVSARSATYTLIGRTQFAAPIQELLNKSYEVKGQVKVALEKDKVYEVHGELGEGYSAVWLEETSEHKLVGEKIELRSK
ncbi:MAG: hypothetical protein K8Q92_00890 [Methylophilales bacterium]|nr:hypothetical protein [Methylophilales bacterium]